jgi:hypothetical protein
VGWQGRADAQTTKPSVGASEIGLSVLDQVFPQC